MSEINIRIVEPGVIPCLGNDRRDECGMMTRFVENELLADPSITEEAARQDFYELYCPVNQASRDPRIDLAGRSKFGACAVGASIVRSREN